MVEAGVAIFVQVGIVIILAAVAALVLRFFKQPQILAYVLVGIFITPVFHLVTDTSIIQSMSIIGIAFLLFLVGMEMDLKALKNVALVSGLGGLMQITILLVLGYFLALLLGFLGLEAAYMGLMVAFSSTMVVLKLLSDKRELNTLHGRIIVGILLVEDIVAIFALSVLTSINEFSVRLLIIALLKFASLFLAAYIASRFIFPQLFKFVAKHQELLLITSLGVCFLFSLVYHYLGFSIAIGAFVAGIALGNLPYNLEIIGRIKSLRDFFALLFFVSLGMGVSLSVLQKMWLSLVMLLILILFLKPFIVMTICSLFKYTKKPAFLTANSLAQMGEFSLIIAAQGLALGHISQDFFSMIIVVTVITIVMTSYFIKHDRWFYMKMQKPLGIFDRFMPEGAEYLSPEVQPSVILCGYNRIGYSVLRSLQREKKNTLIVDYNPEVIDDLVKQGYHCLYGDIGDEEIIERMNLSTASLVVSTIPDMNDTLYLIKKIREVNKKVTIIVTAMQIDNALKLYSHGADYVVLPHFLGGEHVAHLINQFHQKKIKFQEEKQRHIKHLHERKRLGQEHPVR